MFDWLPIEAIGCRSSPRSLRPGQNADPVTVSVVSAVLLSSALLSSAEERFSYTNLCKEQGTSPSRARERERALRWRVTSLVAFHRLNEPQIMHVSC